VTGTPVVESLRSQDEVVALIVTVLVMVDVMVVVHVVVLEPETEVTTLV
jgi:hypothetical protein